MIKDIYEKPTVKMTINYERLKPFLCNQEQGNDAYFHHFNILLEILARIIRQENKIQGSQIGNEEIKLSLFRHGIILPV